MAVNPNELVVGWCDIVRNPHEGFRHVGRLGMGLLPDYRGRGLGRQLVARAVRAARQAGIERVELEVFASNERAIALYRALGFVTEGIKRRARKLDRQYEDNVFMARTLQWILALISIASVAFVADAGFIFWMLRKHTALSATGYA